MAFTKVAAAGINTGGSFVFKDVNTTGVITATSFVGPVTGNATGLSGTPNLNVGVVTANSFYGNGSNITGLTRTLTVAVRVGSAMTVSISGTSFNVSGRSGNIPINI